MTKHDILLNIEALKELKEVYESGIIPEEFHVKYGKICPLCYAVYEDCSRCVWQQVPTQPDNCRGPHLNCRVPNLPCLAWNANVSHLRYHKPLFRSLVEARLALLDTQLTWLHNELAKGD
jgi:hypothetical protein